MIPVASRLLREWRKKAEKTQNQAAIEVGVSQTAWSEYESGAKSPRTETALKLVKITGGEVPIEAWGEKEDPASSPTSPPTENEKVGAA